MLLLHCVVNDATFPFCKPRKRLFAHRKLHEATLPFLSSLCLSVYLLDLYGHGRGCLWMKNGQARVKTDLSLTDHQM